MYFDLEDYHPEEPRVARAISAREGVLLSLIAHLVALVLIILAPRFGWFKPRAVPVEPVPDQVIRFVNIQPAVNRRAIPVHTPEPSDMDRRSATVTHVQPANPAPASLGNTSEKIIASPADSAKAGDPTPPPNAATVPDVIQPPPRPSGAAGLADSLRNLSKYLQNANYNNPQGGQTDRDADISFDSKGIDFGPWLARFRAQVMSNWLIPQAAMVQHGHVVFQFWVARDGTISDVHIVQPAKVDVFNTAAQGALTRSNPTVPLPAAYPTDKILFTVTFFYNEEVRSGGKVTKALIAVVGPTATGKSALGLDLAEAFNGEVVSCDSTAVYRGVDIGTDKLPPAGRRRIPHHLVDIADPTETYSAARFAADAARVIEDIHARGRRPILVGGSGFYFRALVRGLFPGPERDDALRARLERVAGRRGVEALHRWTARVDPESARRIQPRDRKRLVRALEVYLLTGQPLSAHFGDTRSHLQGWPVLAIGLNAPRPVLLERVARRVDAQFAAGVVAEVEGLLARGVPPRAHALTGLVYRQVVEMLEGVRGLDETRALIVRENMRYARRQLVWFRHEAVQWLPEVGDPEIARREARALVEAQFDERRGERIGEGIGEN